MQAHVCSNGTRVCRNMYVVMVQEYARMSSNDTRVCKNVCSNGTRVVIDYVDMQAFIEVP